MKNEIKCFHKSELKNFDLLKGAKVNFIHSQNMTFTEWIFEQDTILPEHSHIHEQITKVLSGKMEIEIEGEKYILLEGSIIVIPPNAVHSAKAVTKCHVVDSFYPVREDYLKFDL